LVIPDEAHHGVAPTWRGILDEYQHATIIGLTATPQRSDGRGLGDIYQVLVEAPQIAELISLGCLVGTRVFAPYIPDLKGVRVERGDYAEGELALRMDKQQLVGDIVAEWLKRAARRTTVAFATSVAHSVHIRDEFRRAGILAEHIDGTTPPEERDEILS